MNVLIVNPILHTNEKGVINRRPTNRHTMAYGLARGFLAAGHAPTLVACEDYRPLQPEENEFEVVYFPARQPKLFKPSVLPSLKGFKSWLKSNHQNYDLIVCSELFQLTTLNVARVCSDKMIVWQELNDYQRLMHRIPARLWYKVIVPLRMKNVRVAGRSEAARDFVSRFAVRTSHMVIDHGVDGDIFVPAEGVELSFAVVSQLIPRKRIDYIIDRFAEFVALDGNADYRLKIIGDGTETEALKEQCRRLGIFDSVDFLGFKYSWEWVPLVNRSVALLMATRQDLNTVTIPESLASGLPVLTNEVPLLGQWLNDEGLGIRKAGWGVAEMQQMVACRDEMHRQCLSHRQNLTNVACANKLIAAFKNLE